MRRLLAAEAVRTGAGVMGDAVLIEQSTIVEVGRWEDLRRPGLPEQSYAGSVIVPGLRDAHLHPIAYAAVAGRPDLSACRDHHELLEILRAAHHELPPGGVLVADRLDDEKLAERRLPVRFDLDRVADDRPILLHRYCGHVGVANTAALERAGVQPGTLDPVGGVIDRDHLGSPTGIVRETALELVVARLDLPAPSGEEVLTGLHQLARLGLTGVTAIVSGREGLWSGGEAELRLLAEVGPDSPIRLSVLVVPTDRAALEAVAETCRELGPKVRFLGLKAFADGSLGGHTAALRRPYADVPEERGLTRLDVDTKTLARETLQMGGRVAVHAIGDRANATVLRLFQDLLEQGAAPEDLRLEHASLLADQDIERLVDSGVTASIQPAFLPSETEMLPKRLGPERLHQAYRFRTLDEAGVPLVGGSDAPVESPAPLAGMAAARDRGGLAPEESLAPDRALALFTDGAALAMGERDLLLPGSPADLTVLDIDPVTAEPERLHRARVVSTWVGGRPVTDQG